MVEPDHPAKRRQAPMEAVHRRLLVDRADRDEWPGQHKKISRTVTQHLVGDVHVAAFRVASPWSLRHGLRLVHA